MKVKREELIQQLELVEPGLSPKVIIQQGTCLVFHEGKILTYNSEVACSLPTTLPLEGAVQAEPLLKILRKLPDDEIDVTQNKSELVIKGFRKGISITMEQEIFLPIESIQKPGKWSKLHEDFTDAVSVVQECASRDLSVEILTCVHITPKWVEATDNMQTARYMLDTGVDEKCLVKRDSIKHIVTLGVTKFSQTDSWLHFKSPIGLVLSCRRMVEENFPDSTEYLKIKGEPTQLPKGLFEAVDCADVFSSEMDNNMVLVRLRPGELVVKGIGLSGKFWQVKKTKYKGVPIAFYIPPALLIELVKRHNEVEVSKDLLKVGGGNWTYITCLGAVEEETKKKGKKNG